jgi:catechol 2,3-dioxygenase-like lactoylglutathione lyase family enzyme
MKALYHVGLTVSDLDRSIDFYHRVLGLEFASEPSGYVSGERMDTALNVAGAKLRAVNFKVGDQGLIELLDYQEPPSALEQAPSCNTTGSGHVAFLVDDIHAKKEELEAKGVQFYGDINYEEEPLATWYWIYFADPDGIPLELVQNVRANAEGRAAVIRAYKGSRGWSK